MHLALEIAWSVAPLFLLLVVLRMRQQLGGRDREVAFLQKRVAGDYDAAAVASEVATVWRQQAIAKAREGGDIEEVEELLGEARDLEVTYKRGELEEASGKAPEKIADRLGIRDAAENAFAAVGAWSPPRLDPVQEALAVSHRRQDCTKGGLVLPCCPFDRHCDKCRADDEAWVAALARIEKLRREVDGSRDRIQQFVFIDGVTSRYGLIRGLHVKAGERVVVEGGSTFQDVKVDAGGEIVLRGGRVLLRGPCAVTAERPIAFVFWDEQVEPFVPPPRITGWVSRFDPITGRSHEELDRDAAVAREARTSAAVAAERRQALLASTPVGLEAEAEEALAQGLSLAAARVRIGNMARDRYAPNLTRIMNPRGAPVGELGESARRDILSMSSPGLEKVAELAITLGLGRTSAAWMLDQARADRAAGRRCSNLVPCTACRPDPKPSDPAKAPDSGQVVISQWFSRSKKVHLPTSPFAFPELTWDSFGGLDHSVDEAAAVDRAVYKTLSKRREKR